MKRKFIETEINDFLGIATGKRKKQKNEAGELLNLDLRGRTGDIELRSGYVQKYAAPTNARLSAVSILEAENLYIPDYGGGREVTVQVGKGTLAAETGSGVTPATLNIPLIFTRPNWKINNSVSGFPVLTGSTSTLIKTAGSTTDNFVGCFLRITATSLVPSSRNSGHFKKITAHTSGANVEFTIDELPYTPAVGDTMEVWSWADEWNWLNETIYTKILAINVDGSAAIMNIHSAYGLTNGMNGWVVTNLTKNESSVILFDEDVGYYTDIAIADINNAWAVDDRILLQRSFIPLDFLFTLYDVIAKDIIFYKLLNDLRISFGGQPGRLALALGLRNKSFQATYSASFPAITGLYNAGVFSQRCKVFLDPINTTSEDLTYKVTVSDTGTGTFPNKIYFYKITAFLDDHSEFLILEGNHTIAVSKNMNFAFGAGATLNKRITAIRIWLSEGIGTADTEATNPFFLVKDIQLTQNDVDYDEQYWTFDNDGYLLVSKVITYPELTNNLGEMLILMGYAATFELANSFDQALVVNKGIYALNPYSDKRWDNKIFKSPESGEAVFMYDVLTGSNYLDAEQGDGNEIVGLGILNNMDFAVLKQNIYSQLDPEYGRIYQTHFEKGSLARKSIVNTGSGLVWAGQHDLIAANTQQILEISEGSIRDQYRALTTKEDIIAAREEKDNAYRFFTGDLTNKTEFVFTKRGWIKHQRTNYPETYIQARDGSVWFMRSGVIYKDSVTTRLDVDQNYNFKWKTIPLDIHLLGEEITDMDRFLINSVWCRYYSNLAFNVKVYLDESATAFQTMAIATGRPYQSLKVYPGANCRVVEIEISGTVNAANAYFELFSAGIEWAPIKVGQFANVN